MEQIAQKILPESKLVRTWSLKGGMSAMMTAMEIESPAGQRGRVIVRQPSAKTLRQNPQAAQVEFALLQKLHSLEFPVPAPILLDASGEIFAAPYLVLEYLEGEPEYAPADLSDYLIRFATLLAQIHRVPKSLADFSFLPEHPGTCAEIAGDSQCGAEALVLTLNPSPIIGRGERRIRETLEEFRPLSPRNTPALLHGDFWPGNLLWREKRLVAVIDWEDACVGEPLADFAISRLDILCLFGTDALNAFTRHYQSQMRLDYIHLPYWDLCAALRLLRLTDSDFAEWAAFYPPVGRPDITEYTLQEHLQFFIQQALEKIGNE